MSNLLEQAIKYDDGEQAARILQQALGIVPESSGTQAPSCLPIASTLEGNGTPSFQPVAVI
jgi:hypothetical protein